MYQLANSGCTGPVLTRTRLKKAYRKKALELHPDRNYGDVERTTALFAEVRAAYEVLSDDQERAWYDAHEGDILRGGTGEGTGEDHYQGNMRITTSDELARMMGKFRGNVEFTDSPSGFFGFVRETFEQLAREEQYAADYEDISIPEYPTFGHKDDEYDDVVKSFYAAWNGFATTKSFAWLDRYRLSDAPDRRVRRLMEKENQKFRDEGRREFNDTVRALLAFVRKRDPRYTPNQQSDEDKAKAQRDARQAQAARARAAQMAKLDQESQAVPDWATARPEDELDEQSEEEIEEEHFECVACNKTFKSERQYEAHEKSKKHQKAIQALKRKMQKDNAHLHLDDDALGSGVITPVDDELDMPVLSSDNSPREVTKHSQEEIADVTTDDSDRENQTAALEHSPQPQPQKRAESNTDSEDDEYASRSDIEARLAEFSIRSGSTAPTQDPDPKPELMNEPENVVPKEPKMGKAAQKRAKKAAKQAETNSSDLGNKCQGCDAAFASKNQLFQHLKDHPKHAALKSTGGGKKGKKK